MTFRSLFVQEHPNRASATEPYSSHNEQAPVFCSLQAYTWPTSAKGFADEHKLHVDYVDNCWLLIALDGSMLKRFLRAGAAVDSDVPARPHPACAATTLPELAGWRGLSPSLNA